MLRRIYDGSMIAAGDDYYRGKIGAYMQAYGGGYEFCRFYTATGSLASGNIMLFNASAVAGGVFSDKDEFQDFIIMNCPQTVELPRGMAERLSLPGYDTVHRTLFLGEIGNFTQSEEVEAGLDSPVSLPQMFIILNSCFEGLKYDLWYTDMSHRVRHGITEPLVYKGCSCISADFTAGDCVYVSSVATMLGARGNGYAGMLLRYKAAQLRSKRKQLYLWADDHSFGYYHKLGFKPVDEDIMFVRK